MGSNLNWLIVGGTGLIWRSTNFGVGWFSQNSGTTAQLTSVEFASTSDHAYCVGYNGTIRKTTNNGGNWGSQLSNTTRNLHSVFFYINDNVGYAVGDSGTILKTTDGGGPIVSVNSQQSAQLSQEFSLWQNFPNPFNPTTVIRYQLPVRSHVILKLYDEIGREVSVLVDGMEQAGFHEASIDGSGLASGMYFYTLIAGEFRSVKKFLLLR
jgi:hypothetical protein